MGYLLEGRITPLRRVHIGMICNQHTFQVMKCDFCCGGPSCIYTFKPHAKDWKTGSDIDNHSSTNQPFITSHRDLYDCFS